MRGPLWSAADDAELRRLYPDPTVTPAALEQRFGRSWMAIKTRAQAFELYRRRPRVLSSCPWTAADEQLLRDLYPDLSLTREEIARRLNRTWRACQHKIHQLNLGPLRERNNPCAVRRDYFRVIDSAEKAYWLGFIAADGCVYIGGRQHTLRLDLQPRDLHWLERFRDIIAPEMHITQHGTRSFSFGIGSQELVADLLALGITPRKSNTLEWPNVPEAHVIPFLLGYFDGDGCLHRRPGRRKEQYQWSMVGTLPFLTVARDYIQQLCSVSLHEPIRKSPTRSPNTYLIFASGSRVIAIDRVLNASGLGLPRKHLPV
jgi:hypothetical protein